MRVVRVDAVTGRELRMSVLRPHEPADRPMYEREDDPGTVHVAAIAEAGEPLAVGSAMSDPHPREPRDGDWRIRGMATRPDARGRGLGSLVLAELERAAAEQDARRVWCNARSGARRFYERAGYAAEGEEYEIAGIGPHWLMVHQLA